MSIAAAGAAMVSLIEHAHDARTPPGTSWLLAGAVVLGLLALAVTERTLVDAQRLVVVYQPLSPAMGVGAAAALVVGWARPAPWLLALLLGAILPVLWFVAVSRFLRADAWPEPTGRPRPLIQVPAARRGARLATTSAGVRRGDQRRRARGHPPQALVFSA
jgi:hypothetical protein